MSAASRARAASVPEGHALPNAAAASAAASPPVAKAQPNAAAAVPARAEGTGSKAGFATNGQENRKLMKRLQRKARDSKVKLEMSRKLAVLERKAPIEHHLTHTRQTHDASSAPPRSSGRRQRGPGGCHCPLRGRHPAAVGARALPRRGKLQRPLVQRRRRHRGKDFDKELRRVIAQHRRYQIARGDKRFKATKGLIKWSRPNKTKRANRTYYRKRKSRGKGRRQRR